MITLSIVIVTYGRQQDLGDLLQSIAAQSMVHLLQEVVIVDNHKQALGEKVVVGFSTLLNTKYIKNEVNSLTSGRSIGASSTTSDVVLFLDDDVVLYDGYLANLFDFYKQNPNANGMQGVFDVGDYNKLKNVFSRLFFLFNYSRRTFDVYPSIQASYATEVDKIMESQWFSGTNFSYRSHVLKSIAFDLNLVKYCEGEDIDYSYRVFRKFGGLFTNPHCRVDHRAAETSRAIGMEFAVMQEIYGRYLLRKLFPNSTRSQLKYIISRVGKLLLYLAEVLLGRQHAISNLKNYIWALKRSIVNNDIHKFNEEIRK